MAKSSSKVSVRAAVGVPSRLSSGLDVFLGQVPLTIYEAVPSEGHIDLWSLLYVSSAVETLTGHPPSDFYGESPAFFLFELIHPQDRGRVGAQYDRCRIIEAPVNIRYRLKHATQGYRLVEERSTFERDGRGRLHVFGTLIDITEPERHMERQADLDTTLAGLNADVAVATGQEFVQQLCRRLTVLTGVRQVGIFRVDKGRYLECLALVRDGLLQPRYGIAVAQSIFTPLADQKKMELRLDAHEQSWAILKEITHITAIRLNNRQHQWLGVLALGHDGPIKTDHALDRVLELYSDRSVTEIERLALEHRLQDSESRYRAFFDTAVQAFLVVNLQGRVVNFNRSAGNLFGLADDQEAESLDLADIFPKRQPDGRLSLVHFLRFVRQSLTRPPQPSQWSVQSLNGRPRTVTVHAVPTVLNLSERVMLTFEDITDKLEAERILQEQNELLNQRQGRLRDLVRLATRLERQASVADFMQVASKELSHQDGISAVAYLELPLQLWHPVTGTETDGDLRLDDHRAHIDQVLFDGHPRWAGQGPHWLYCPLMNNTEAVAVLVLGCRSSVCEDQEFISLLIQTLGLSIDNLLQRRSLRHQAMRDSLTKLGNRAQLHEWIRDSLQAKPDQKASLLLFDLNRFKEINDSLGHHLGDRLLCEIGPRLKEVLEPSCDWKLARLGGDEFAVFLPELTPLQSMALAERVGASLAQPYIIDSLQLQVEASIGLAYYPDQGRDGHELLRCADVAMYAAKRGGRPWVAFEASLDANTPQRIAVLSELDQALTEGQIWVAYQPVVHAKDGKVAGFEALARWEHPVLGALSPAEFIPIAEMGQGIHRITRFVLNRSLEALVRWRESSPDLYMAVNLSSRVLLDHALPSQIALLLQQHRLPGTALVLELTESTLLTDPLRAIDIINDLAELGVQVAVDDFGTGYSSLAYLKSLPIQALKIDKSFVVDLLLDPQDRIIIESTIKMAHNLGLAIIAEGVEDEATLVELMKMNCDAIQGFYFSKPIGMEDMTVWLARNV